MNHRLPGYAGALLAVVLACGTSIASAEPFSYLRVAGSSFVPRDGSTKLAYGAAGCVLLASGAPWIVYPVQLPTGSRIVSMRVYYYDVAPNTWLTAALTRYNGSGGITDEVFFDVADNSSGYSTHDRAMDLRINNQESATQILVSFSDAMPSLRLCGVRLTIDDMFFKDSFE
jgi:hypothetical protein